MNLESHTPSPEPINPTMHLGDFYRRLYSHEKHDSPDESRTSLVRRIRQLIQAGEITPRRILNIGSGPQALERQLLSKSQGGEPLRKEAQFVSLDLADIMPVKLLAQSIDNVRHIRANAVELPFKGGSFGLVVSNHAIDFAPQAAAFREAYRVLSEGGKAIFYLHHPSMIEQLPDDKKKNQKDVRIFWQYLRDNSILFANEKDIKSFLSEAGFVPLEISLKTDEARADKWWEVVAEKTRTVEN